MRAGAAVLAALVLVACGSTDPQPPAPLPAPAAAAVPDPRVAEMQVLLNELMDRLEVVTARLAALESGAAAAAGPQTASAPARSIAARPAPPTGRSAPARPTTAAIGERYKEALALFGKGRLDDARSAFEQILAADPSGDLADNALFWIGETHFVQARFNDAIAVWQRVVSEYGQQNKAPDAMLKIGMSQARLGDLAMARSTFEALLERYPYSTAAATARHEVQRIRY